MLTQFDCYRREQPGPLSTFLTNLFVHPLAPRSDQVVNHCMLAILSMHFKQFWPITRIKKKGINKGKLFEGKAKFSGLAKN